MGPKDLSAVHAVIVDLQAAMAEFLAPANVLSVEATPFDALRSLVFPVATEVLAAAKASGWPAQGRVPAKAKRPTVTALAQQQAS